jgi:hypothetical protein
LSEYADPVDVHWISPDGSSRKVAGLVPGGGTEQSSFYGHRFFFESKGRKTEPVICRKGTDNIYKISRDFVINAGYNEL